MSYLNTYFAGNYNDYLNYFEEEYRNTFFKFVLKSTAPIFGVRNGGGVDQDDWKDPINGLGLGWNISYIFSQNTSIVTGNGFNGNAQRFATTSNPSDTQAILSIELENLDPTIKYKVRVKYRTNGITAGLRLDGGTIEDLLYNEGNALQIVSAEFPVSGTTALLEFLIQESDRFLEIDEVEIAPGEEIYLVKENPAGWEKLQIKWDRSSRYNGIFRNYAVSLKWYLRNTGGGEFINSQYDLYDILAVVTVEIYEKDFQTGDYIKFYDGILDYKPGRFKQLHSKRFAEIGIKDGSKESQVLDREEIDYDVFSNIAHNGTQLTPLLETSILLPPINLLLRVEARMEIIGSKLDIIFSNNDTPVSYYPALIDTTINDIDDRLVASGAESTIYENSTDFDVVLDLTDASIYDQTNVITLQPAPFGNEAEVTIVVGISIYDEDDVEIQTEVIDNFQKLFTQVGGATYYQYVNFDFSAAQTQWSIPSGGKMTMYSIYKIDAGMFGYKVSYSQNTKFNFKAFETFPSVSESAARGMFYHDLIGKIIQLATGETDESKVFRSALLGKTTSEYGTYASNGKWANLFLTSGFNVRQFPDRGLLASLKASFKTLFAIEPIGMGFDRSTSQFYIEQLARFYDETNFMFALGEVDEFESEPYEDAYIPNIKAGWPEVDFEDLNGVSEFNLPLEYNVDQPGKKSVDWRAEYLGASVAIEIPRRKPYATNSAEDTKYDELRMVVLSDGIRAIQGKSGDTNLEGIVNIEEYYNISISGRENMIRHEGLLTPMLWKRAQNIRFLSLKKGTKIQYTTFKGKVVMETDTIMYDELNGRYFVPKLDTFVKEVNRNIITVMNTDPHGFITYSNDGEDFSGFIKTLDVESYPSTAEWTTIRREYIAELNFVFENEDNVIDEQEDNFIFE